MDGKGTLYGEMSGKITLDGDLSEEQYLHAETVVPNPVRGYVANDPHMATDDYDALSNRPKINGVTLTGNKRSIDLGIDTVDYATLADIDSIFLEEG